MMISSSKNPLVSMVNIKFFHRGLKRHKQAKIIRISGFLFRLLNISIRCEHVYRLES